ncbi:MAG: NAD(P)-binding protein [Xanthomonadales bacterium]|nr:NAD(P)-binding protein [Xanthomonadales bacterium]
MSRDKELGMFRPINRRQFCQGTAVALGASLAPWAQGITVTGEFVGSPEITSAYYPPAIEGLRGAHVGAFEVAHGVVREAKRWNSGTDTGEGEFDLVIIGAGLSGLSAAWFYHQQKPAARILLLDNHDDFGGHAKRNEYSLKDGQTMIGYGGSQSIDTPSSYSPEAMGLLRGIGIDVQKFYQAYDRDLYNNMNLQTAWWLDQQHFGSDRLVKDIPLGWSASSEETPEQLRHFAEQVSSSSDDVAAWMRILTSEEDFLAGKTSAGKVAYLRSLSYTDYLQQYFAATESVLQLMYPLTSGLWGCGLDALSAREAMDMGFPGFDGLKVDLETDDPYYKIEEEEPYIFHFPDGNASIARMLVRQLVPATAPGNSMEDIVTAKFDYTALDRPSQPVKIRLNSTAVQVQHLGGNDGDLKSAKAVAVRYVKAGAAHDVRARDVIFAGYSAMIPHICPEFPAAQTQAFATQVKIPLLYANMLVRNWQPFVKLGVNGIRFPGGLMDSVVLDFPVSLGDYHFHDSPDQPAILHWTYVPISPGQGLDARTQNKLGRHKMLELSFADYERAMRQQAADALATGGFDPARDILGITVNRWPHGYAYEYNDLVDPPDWSRYKGPHIEARQPFGRVSIAGSDSEAFAYVNGAIDAAWRAVNERLG